MEADDGIFSDLKHCLLDFEYPLANTMEDEQLADIFNRPNRCFLVSWIINLLNGACGGTLENIENNDEEYLGNLIYELGICRKTESLPFMRGQLSLCSQLKIIQKMFNCLRRACQSVPQMDVMQDDIESLKTLDLNLFPQYGDIKVRNTPKANDMEDDEDDDDELSHFSKTKIEQPVNQIDHEKFHQDLEMWVKQTREDFPSITSTISTVEKLKLKNDQHREIVHVDQNSTEVLRKCNEYLKVINQYLIDLNTIKDFNKDDVSDHGKNSTTNEEWRKILHGIYDNVSEVVKYSNLKD